MKTTKSSKKASKKNPHDAAFAELDAAMTASDKAYWAAAEKAEKMNAL